VLRLQPPVKSDEQLCALAASGSSTFSRAAKAEIARRMNDRLAASLRQQQSESAAGSA